ncbi:MAG: DEAD/DEAH box helicase [Gammaproteobacteria bacterium]|nr:DEAD/DEAH box helicase [Gammaproteobacteria bacterium]
MPLTNFHPAVAEWFEATFGEPTGAQRAAWPQIAAGEHTLIAAPTGSGKTLAAFLSAINDLVVRSVADELVDQVYVVYVSPLKALSNDIQRNLEQPLQGIGRTLIERGCDETPIRTAVRTGDTPQAERAAMVKKPPHILVTTPESLYILLTSESGRAMLGGVRTVIVDEIHAMADSKRGSHLTLSLERLTHLCSAMPQRVGLSATQKPIETVAHFLVGNAPGSDTPHPCKIVDEGHTRQRDLDIVVPPSPLEAVMANEIWGALYDQIAALIKAHTTTLIFVNTRRLAERVTANLSDRIGEEHITSHHGSLAKEKRFDAEQKLKAGELKALVATASLELGIDIGDVDLVIQLGSPKSISAFLQRVGRSGHSVGGCPKGRLFPLSRDDLVECVALIDAARRGELDNLLIPEQPLDVLTQQLIAELSAGEWQEDALYQRIRCAYPYRHLSRQTFDDIMRMAADGYSTRRGRRSAYVHRDVVQQQARGRRGARLTAMTSGGTIPDNADYKVVLEPSGTFIGTLNEDFAIESMAGDIFQLGNASWRILRIESGTVRVEDAAGLPPTVPFWIGEAPARSDELSDAVSRLRQTVGDQVTESGIEATVHHLVDALALAPEAAQQLVEYLAAAQAALGVMPSKQAVVLERFFDETGGMQLVVHSPFGSRINRAWGLSLRKRFCRKFNFELQAAATEDSIVLSLGATHSFPLAEVAGYLNAKTVRTVLIQAMLDAPLFQVRWRWNATNALAIPRFRGGKKRPPQLARIEAEDLVALIFPDQLACFENIAGEREVPDHPLVNQTIHDCLTEAMDIDGLEALLTRLEAGDLQFVCADLSEPSPLAQEILSAKPYAFLDDAPLEERRTQAVVSRRWLDPETAADIGQLDPEAIERVRDEAWPEVRNADELHDALVTLGYVTEAEMAASRHAVNGWLKWAEKLAVAGRATRLQLATGSLWIALERLPECRAVFPESPLEPALQLPLHLTNEPVAAEQALVELLRSRLEGLGPVTAERMCDELGLPVLRVDQALLALESEGFAMRGQFTEAACRDSFEEWCERRLLARINRYTVKRLRKEIEPVSSADFMRFLFDWQGVLPEERGEGADYLKIIIEQLAGFEAPASAWESDILPTRLNDYTPDWLDTLCLSGRSLWARLTPSSGKSQRHNGPVKNTPIALFGRRQFVHWQRLMAAQVASDDALSPNAESVAMYLCEHGASFADELQAAAGGLRTQLEQALAELVGRGRVTSDSFSGLRLLLTPSNRRQPLSGSRRRGRTGSLSLEDTGRWTLLNKAQPAESAAESTPGWFGSAFSEDTVTEIATDLLSRYGVVFRALLERESRLLPPWRDLLRVYRRMEARGELRGGRFVNGFTGEQYALPEAVTSLREVRKQVKSGVALAVSGADPLNLVGIITPGKKVPALASNRILYRDGEPIATKLGDDVVFLVSLSESEQWDARNKLLKTSLAPRLKVYLGQR